MTKLEELINKNQLPGARPISYKHTEEILRQAKYTGPVTTHWRDGIPRKIEAGHRVAVVVELSADSSTDSSAAEKVLDNGR